MSSTATPIRRAFRDSENGLVGGVCSGLATHLGVPVLWVRVGFVAITVLTYFLGLGLFLYAALWILLPAASPVERSTPGGESAGRGGRNPRRVGRLADAGPVIAVSVLGLGLVLTLQTVIGTSTVFWAVAIAAVGIGLLWRQADEAQRDRWLDRTARVNPVRVVFGKGGWQAWTRVVVGIALVFTAVSFIWLSGVGEQMDGWAIPLAALLLVSGLVFALGPWVYRLATDLSAEREERVRSQERADVAAHLHDSVLQTLALIQRNADDPTTVAQLARSQERDLRSWLYEAPSSPDENLSAALKAAAAAIEDAHGVTVDVVAVGDGPVDEHSQAIVAAAREAMTNAAKHAGTGRVDVYAEISDDQVDVFVRDRGAGFVLDEISDDRLGVRGSIIARMERHHGTAEIRSTPGEGTEVRLHQSRQSNDS